MQPNLLKGKFCRNPISMRPCRILQTQWRCPPIVILDPNWFVAAGEESTEVVSQRHDETDLRDNDDSSTPEIPLSPTEIPLSPIEIEEGEILEDDASESITITPSMKLVNQHEVITCGTPVTPDNIPPISVKQTDAGEAQRCKLPVRDDMLSVAMAGAAAALTAYTSYQGDPNLIDMGLLIQLLNNPDTLIKLVRGQVVPSSTGTHISEPRHEARFMLPEVSFPLPQNEHSEFPSTGMQPTRSVLQSPHPIRQLSQVYRPPVLGEGPLLPLPGTTIMTVEPYARSDLHRNGNTQFVGQGPSYQTNSSASMLNAPQRCIYFRSSVGCRRGTSCPYLHNESDQPAPSRAEPLPSAKKMKLDQETSRTM